MGTALPDVVPTHENARPRERSRHARASIAFALALCAIRVAHADLIVPSGGQYATGGGQTNLACTDVVVAGTLLVASGSLVNVRHLTIQPGGTIDGGSGVIQVGGNWSNGGTFTAGASTVRFDDACGLPAATINGSTSFFNARFTSTTGKNHVFQVGTTQTIAGLLEILGTASSPIQFRSSAAGQVANIDLLPAGAQNIVHVGVTDVWATGQHLAPAQSNEGGGGNAVNWFGLPSVTEIPIPTLGHLALLMLAALSACVATIELRRRRLTRNIP